MVNLSNYLDKNIPTNELPLKLETNQSVFTQTWLQ